MTSDSLKKKIIRLQNRRDGRREVLADLFTENEAEFRTLWEKALRYFKREEPFLLLDAIEIILDYEIGTTDKLNQQLIELLQNGAPSCKRSVEAWPKVKLSSRNQSAIEQAAAEQIGSGARAIQGSGRVLIEFEGGLFEVWSTYVEYFFIQHQEVE